MNLVPPDVNELNNGLTEVIPVIASFDSSGNVMPLYLRIQGYQYKVLRCWFKQCGPIYYYYCTVENNRMQKEIVVTYHPREKCWAVKLK